MKYKFTVLFGIAFGVGMSILWGPAFSNIFGIPGMVGRVCFGIAFAGCGCLFGYAIDSADNDKKK